MRTKESKQIDLTQGPFSYTGTKTPTTSWQGVRYTKASANTPAICDASEKIKLLQDAELGKFSHATRVLIKEGFEREYKTAPEANSPYAPQIGDMIFFDTLHYPSIKSSLIRGLTSFAPGEEGGERYSHVGVIIGFDKKTNAPIIAEGGGEGDMYIRQATVQHLSTGMVYRPNDPELRENLARAAISSSMSPTNWQEQENGLGRNARGEYALWHLIGAAFSVKLADALHEPPPVSGARREAAANPGSAKYRTKDQVSTLPVWCSKYMMTLLIKSQADALRNQPHEEFNPREIMLLRQEAAAKIAQIYPVLVSETPPSIGAEALKKLIKAEQLRKNHKLEDAMRIEAEAMAYAKEVISEDQHHPLHAVIDLINQANEKEAATIISQAVSKAADDTELSFVAANTLFREWYEKAMGREMLPWELTQHNPGGGRIKTFIPKNIIIHVSS